MRGALPSQIGERPIQVTVLREAERVSKPSVPASRRILRRSKGGEGASVDYALAERDISYTGSMKPTGALFASAAIAVLTIAGGILFTHAADSSSAPVAWAEEAGSGTIFPACGSAQASATCVNSTGTASLTWDFSLGGSGPSTLVTFTSPSGAQLVKQTFSGVVGSVSVPKLGPGTHTLSAVPTYGAGADPSGGATNSISVPNCLSCTTNTGCSGNDLYYLDTSGGFCNFIA